MPIIETALTNKSRKIIKQQRQEAQRERNNKIKEMQETLSILDESKELLELLELFCNLKNQSLQEAKNYFFNDPEGALLLDAILAKETIKKNYDVKISTPNELQRILDQIDKGESLDPTIILDERIGGTLIGITDLTIETLCALKTSDVIKYEAIIFHILSELHRKIVQIEKIDINRLVLESVQIRHQLALDLTPYIQLAIALKKLQEAITSLKDKDAIEIGNNILTTTKCIVLQNLISTEDIKFLIQCIQIEELDFNKLRELPLALTPYIQLAIALKKLQEAITSLKDKDAIEIGNNILTTTRCIVLQNCISTKDIEFLIQCTQIEKLDVGRLKAIQDSQRKFIDKLPPKNHFDVECKELQEAINKAPLTDAPLKESGENVLKAAQHAVQEKLVSEKHMLLLIQSIRETRAVIKEPNRRSIYIPKLSKIAQEMIGLDCEWGKTVGGALASFVGVAIFLTAIAAAATIIAIATMGAGLPLSALLILSALSLTSVVSAKGAHTAGLFAHHKRKGDTVVALEKFTEVAAEEAAKKNKKLKK